MVYRKINNNIILECVDENNELFCIRHVNNSRIELEYKTYINSVLFLFIPNISFNGNLVPYNYKVYPEKNALYIEHDRSIKE